MMSMRQINEEILTMATLNEIADAIRAVSNANEDSWNGDAAGFVNSIDPDYSRQREIELPGVGTAVYVDGEGGYEGGPEDISLVFRVGEDLYRIKGSYDSYDADRWYANTLRAVVPVEKTIIVYEVVE
jgi:hypothetical protein